MFCKYCSFLQIENLWQPCLERVDRSHFSSSIDSSSVSVSHFGNSHTISNIFMIIPFVAVICDQWSYWCYCCSSFGIFLAVNYFLIKVCTFFLDILCAWCLVSWVQLFATPWTVVCQAVLSMGILQARILEWVALPSSRGSSQPRDWTQVSHIEGRWFFTVWAKDTQDILLLHA